MTSPRFMIISAMAMGYSLMVSAHTAEGASGQGDLVGREILNMDFDWRFSLGNAAEMKKDFDYWGGNPAGDAKTGSTAGPPNPGFDDSSWQFVDVPHDWGVTLGYDRQAEQYHAYKRMGRKYPENCIGWYRKAFNISREDLGKRITFEFDGVFRDCEIWLNGHPVWQHQSGYTSFGFDVTDYLNYDGKNILVVRADASGYELWSYEGAGIYRHVRMVKTSGLHVRQWGTHVRAEVDPSRSSPTATLSILTELENQQAGRANGEVISTIRDAQGNTVASKTTEFPRPIGPWRRRAMRQTVQVPDAHLWSLESPYLYSMLTTVKQDGETVDTYVTSFGIRSIRFDPDKGFFLNGKHVKLKGTCIHQDHGGVGVAIPDRVHDYRVERLRDMGANAIRTAHNWVAPEALGACDRLGLLVMNETRMSGSSRELLEQLGSMVRRDRNHPSVILWCLGNEEHVIQTNETGERIMATMRREVHKHDRSRPVTLAVHGGDGGPVNNSLDVLGCNYLNLGNLDALHEKLPDKAIYVSESSCTSTVRGNYYHDEMNRSTGYDDGAYSPGWGRPAEAMWKYVVDRDYLAGTFVWTGFDYGGEPHSNPWPGVHTDWGVMDRACFPKDNFYYYQSWWSDKTVLHLLPHWNWAGKEGETIRIWAQSNCQEVELIVNGDSLGKKKMERNSHLEWEAPYHAGYIELKGFNEGNLVATTRRKTTGPPAAIRLKPAQKRITADNRDVSLVTVEILDDQGRLMPIADNTIDFTVEGDGRIIGICNGDPSCHVTEDQTTYPVFNGLMMVFVQAGWESGTITLKATSPGLATARAEIEAQAGQAKPYVETVLSENFGTGTEPEGGTFESYDDLLVTLSAPSEHVEIRYTLDGSDPTGDSLLYAEPFRLTGPATVKSRIFVHFKGIGAIATAEFK